MIEAQKKTWADVSETESDEDEHISAPLMEPIEPLTPSIEPELQ